MKGMEDDYLRKISSKERKMQELADTLEERKEEILKIKKNCDEGSLSQKDKIGKLEK
jgi:hypothetical protein